MFGNASFIAIKPRSYRLRGAAAADRERERKRSFWFCRYKLVRCSLKRLNEIAERFAAMNPRGSSTSNTCTVRSPRNALAVSPPLTRRSQCSMLGWRVKVVNQEVVNQEVVKQEVAVGYFVISS